tara:strand:+ start:154 stop:300 length:147 start_codon:yes stop_codon:yes gene_type:complete
MKEEIIKLENILNSLKDKVVHWSFQTEYDYAIKDVKTLIKALKNKEVA